MERSEALGMLPYWDKLSDKQKEYVAGNSAVRKFAKGESVHGYGSACMGTLLILGGKVRVYMVSEDGREITLFNLKKGDSCVLSASCVIRQVTFETNMVAEDDSEMLVVGAKAFDRAAEENVYVKCYMYQVATERFSEVMEAMQRILFLGMDGRLSTFLLSERAKTGKNVIRMTHAEIAVQISSAREVVARTLKRFEKDGVVSLKRGSVTIVDVGALEKLKNSV